jgi:hypothetical protein
MAQRQRAACTVVGRDHQLVRDKTQHRDRAMAHLGLGHKHGLRPRPTAPHRRPHQLEPMAAAQAPSLYLHEILFQDDTRAGALAVVGGSMAERSHRLGHHRHLPGLRAPQHRPHQTHTHTHTHTHTQGGPCILGM